ncbi:MAG: helix-turn-helix transcriptional regulator, partial [Bacteroidota bacterium]
HPSPVDPKIMKLRIVHILFCMVVVHLAKAQYTIEGKVNLGDEWQPKIFMAAVNKLSEYYSTSPDMIVNTAPVGPDGSFLLEGDNLPAQPQFYRIYLMKKQNTDYDACLYVGGDDHNFAHVLLANGAKLSLNANPQSQAPFGEYDVQGDKANQLMRTLARIVFPSFYFYRIKFPTELKFSEDKLHIDLRQFADTCSNPLVALAAINNTDFDEYFDRDEAFYQQFGERLKSELPNSIYTKNYQLKVRYYANEENGFPRWATALILALSVLSLGLLLQLLRYRHRLQLLEAQPAGTSTATPLRPADVLTQKEQQILQLIGEGKSNKEIAAQLFVELSTVKTHINKIYSKIGVSNRKEAQQIVNQ